MESGADSTNSSAGCLSIAPQPKLKGCKMTRPMKSKNGPAVKLSITISPESAAKLTAYCKKNDRAVSWVIDKLLALYIDKLP